MNVQHTTFSSNPLTIALRKTILITIMFVTQSCCCYIICHTFIDTSIDIGKDRTEQSRAGIGSTFPNSFFFLSLSCLFYNCIARRIIVCVPCVCVI